MLLTIAVPRCQPARMHKIMRAVGYVRASTEEQERSGLGLSAQRTAIDAACAQREWDLVGIEEDIASGGKRDRPGLTRALASIDSGEADCVIVSRLDRLGRSVAHVASVLERYPGAIVALDIGLTPDSPAGAFTAHVIAAAAELERALTRERTREALRAAVARGTKLGRPREVSAEAESRILDLHRQGYRVAQIARQLNEEAIATPRGGRCHSPGVQRVLGWGTSQGTRRCRIPSG
jgi:DNA invertase Pin-like site-specific DNA recombinase